MGAQEVADPARPAPERALTQVVDDAHLHAGREREERAIALAVDADDLDPVALGQIARDVQAGADGAAHPVGVGDQDRDLRLAGLGPAAQDDARERVREPVHGQLVGRDDAAARRLRRQLARGSLAGPDRTGPDEEVVLRGVERPEAPLLGIVRREHVRVALVGDAVAMAPETQPADVEVPEVRLVVVVPRQRLEGDGHVERGPVQRDGHRELVAVGPAPREELRRVVVSDEQPADADPIVSDVYALDLCMRVHSWWPSSGRVDGMRER